MSKTTHIVKQGDTLSRIAKEHGLSIDELLDLNQTLLAEKDRSADRIFLRGG